MDIESTELGLLKERATAMGINYHPSIGLDKLREKVEAKLTPSIESLTVENETIPQRNARLRKEANKLIRVRLTCMNPAKKSWPGEVISVLNNAIGSIKKFVPFEAEDGYHLPAVILGVLKEREYQSFYTKTVNGKKIKKGKMAKEFSIEVLPDLTIEELKDLAVKQARQENTEY